MRISHGPVPLAAEMVQDLRRYWAFHRHPVRHFLPGYLSTRPILTPAQWRAIRAITHVIPYLLGDFATRKRLRSYNLGEGIIRLNGFH